MHVVTTQSQPRRLAVPKAPVLVMDGAGFLCLTLDGELVKMTPAEARTLVRETMPIVCYAPMLARAMKIDSFHAYDVLSLFAFVHPGKFTVPTPTGLARALSLMEPETAEDQCLSLRDAARHLLADLSAPGREEKSNAAALAAMMSMGANDGNAGWPWTRAVLLTLGRDEIRRRRAKSALHAYLDNLAEWAVHAPEPSAGHHGIEAAKRRSVCIKCCAARIRKSGWSKKNIPPA
jgi:ATP-dependent DNA helicase DinG